MLWLGRKNLTGGYMEVRRSIGWRRGKKEERGIRGEQEERCCGIIEKMINFIKIKFSKKSNCKS